MAIFAAVIVLLGGCVSMPDEGPVVPTDIEATNEEGRAMSIDAAPPTPGASATEVVVGFLDAMEASPIRLDVARQYLTEDSQDQWDPESSTVVHSGLSPPQIFPPQVTVAMDVPERLDSRGTWQGRLPADQQTLTYDVVDEDGEWRVDDPMDALVVSAGWFEARYDQASVFFFDRSSRRLVPEPVFVPGGEQSATSLVQALLAGPPANLGSSAETFVPGNLEVELSVPVSSTGVADISLVGGAQPLEPEVAELMVAQFAWTLRADPAITSFTITIDSTDVRLPGGETEFAVTDTGRFDPNGNDSVSELFGLVDGLLVTGADESLEPVTGPLGEREVGLESVAVDLTGQTALAVSGGGTSLLRTRVRAGDDDETATVEQVVSGATDLARPVWDTSGRAWLLDRALGGSRVSYLLADRLTQVRVPGVSGVAGARVRQFRVSRDGSRYLAVVRRQGLDSLRVGRLRTAENGRRVVATRAVPLRFAGSGRLRINDVAWASPTQVLVLSPVLANERYEVRTVTVGGGPPGLSTSVDTVNGRVRGLVASPVVTETDYARTTGSLIELDGTRTLQLPDGVTELSYAG